MYGLAVIEGISLSGHLSNIDEIKAFSKKMSTILKYKSHMFDTSSDFEKTTISKCTCTSMII